MNDKPTYAAKTHARVHCPSCGLDIVTPAAAERECERLQDALKAYNMEYDVLKGDRNQLQRECDSLQQQLDKAIEYIDKLVFAGISREQIAEAKRDILAAAPAAKLDPKLQSERSPQEEKSNPSE